MAAGSCRLVIVVSDFLIDVHFIVRGNLLENLVSRSEQNRLHRQRSVSW